jgi:hypothetical protein
MVYPVQDLAEIHQLFHLGGLGQGKDHRYGGHLEIDWHL